MSDDEVWRDTAMYHDFVRAEREADIYDRFGGGTSISWSLDSEGVKSRAGSGTGSLKTVKDRVLYLLQKYPETRNSDLLLIILYLREFTELGRFIRYIPFKLLKRYEGITESVRRARQLIQSSGQYLPTDPEVLEARKKKERRLRRLLGGRDV